LPYLLTLPAHGFLWFKLTQKAEIPAWHEDRLPRDEVPVLVLFDGWESFFRDRVVPWRIGAAERVRARFEREVLPGYFALQRWYARSANAASFPRRQARCASSRRLPMRSSRRPISMRSSCARSVRAPPTRRSFSAIIGS